MTTPVEVIEFRLDDTSAVERAMAELAERGSGWINLGPALSAAEWEAVPHRTGLVAWFSSRGPAVPMATWTPGRPGPAEIGVAHGSGPRAVERLGDEGLALPPGWQKRQDHAKHGIVAEIPDGADPHVVIDWLVGAMTRLSMVLPAGEWWMAEVHRPA
jgi:hypothetical protein